MHTLHIFFFLDIIIIIIDVTFCVLFWYFLEGRKCNSIMIVHDLWHVCVYPSWAIN